jgi:hypothetical protein
VFIPLKTECTGMFPHEHCRRRQPKSFSRSCSHTSQQRQAPQEQRLQGITHVRCIDIVRPPVQRSSERRWTRTKNPAARCCPARGVSPKSRARLQTWELDQREEDGRWMNEPRGLWGVYIVGSRRYHLPHMPPP